MCAALPLKPAAAPVLGSFVFAAVPVPGTSSATAASAAPSSIAARRRLPSGLMLPLEDTPVVHDLSAHEGEDGEDPLELLVGHLRVVVAQHEHVGALADLDRAELV